MPTKTFTRNFTFDSKDTCKSEWRFTLSDGDENGAVIEDLEIIPHTTDDGDPRGCWGHPATIIALLRGLPVSSIDVDALTTAVCARNIACGQALARCLKELISGR